MAGDAEQKAGPRQPDGRRPAQATTVRKAIAVGAIVVLLVGGASSLATARLTDRQVDLEEQQAQITQLASQVSQQEAQIAQLTSHGAEGADEVDRLNAEIAALKGQVFALEAEKLSLEEQLSQILNPAPGPPPTAHLTASWVGLYNGYSIATVVCVEIENTSESDVSISYSSSQFAAIDSNDFVYPLKAGSEAPGVRLETPLSSGQLSPGEKRRGELWYDVPLQAVLARLVWNAGLGATPEIIVALPAAGSYPNIGLPIRVC
jgi:cell division protein FtsB